MEIELEHYIVIIIASRIFLQGGIGYRQLTGQPKVDTVLIFVNAKGRLEVRSLSRTTREGEGGWAYLHIDKSNEIARSRK